MGFTLIELMICIAITAIVVAVAVPALIDYSKRHREHAEQEAAQAIPIATAYNWNDELKDKLKVVCIDGFEYYFASITGNWTNNSDDSRAVLAPKFDATTALPKRCVAEQEKKP
jgi:prepilin-type N-terminal cleavage/methylation domain-containing protein